jgi:radical SAM family uncharacterized protein
MTLMQKIESVLSQVSKPARYTGNELNTVRKSWNGLGVKLAFAFPDVYEVGMSHLGGKILYSIVNEKTRHLMERTFAPWPDMEAKMRAGNIPLYSLESFTPVRDFDLVGFSLQYELSYSNILNMLDLAGIPLKREERGDEHPLIIAGGPCAFNPEPLAEFIDAFVIGDGEDVLLEILDAFDANRSPGRKSVLRAWARIPGVYVPAFFTVDYHPDGTIATMEPVHHEMPSRIKKRVVEDLEKADFPERPIVPNLEIIHDRAALEIMRGCQRGCRYCQAGIIYRPARERNSESLKELARALMRNTGFDEISLASLSSADFEGIQSLVRALVQEHGPRGIGVALPSLRADAFSVGLAEEVQKVRKTTLTFAPEAGTQRLRDVINKNITEEDILNACQAAFRSGWLGIKLYFMLGLPTETEEDLDGIIELVKKIKRAAGEVCRRPPKINVSLAFFVPKPHTPFQWVGQVSRDEMEAKKKYLLERGKIKNVKLSFHDADTSYLEGVLARGDRRIGEAIHRAWKKGAKFDGWSEFFDLELYLSALEECGLDPWFYATRPREKTEVLPWDIIDTGISKEFLMEEYERAYQGRITPNCREYGCQGCGICPELELSPKYWTGGANADQGRV